MRPSAKARRVSARTVVLLLMLAWVGLIGGLTWYLADSQSRARRDVAQRLAMRASAAVEFASLYVQDIYAREHAQAGQALGAKRVSSQILARVASGLGFGASVLLDHDGRVLQAIPAKPGLVGRIITGPYPHLASAVAGKDAVSNVVPSAAHGVPVVAFAVPFASTSGTRIFSGAYDVSKTPLGAYLSHAIVVPGKRVYLVDASGSLIATSGPRPKAGTTLGQLDKRLVTQSRGHPTGAYDSAHGRQFFVSAAVAGTPWRMIVAVPESQLYSSVDGPSKWLAWVAVASLALAGLVIIMLGSRLLRSRERLAELNGELERLARIDPLTGLKNRRDIEETLVGALSSARRYESSLSVLLIDIDHFKDVNDTRGHQAGDAVLRSTAQTIAQALRTEDAVGRWGGEEFLAVLPHTDARGAVVIAERLRAQVARPGPGRSDPRAAMTVTIGVAEWASGGMDDLISRADHALYAGKDSGRDNVQLAPPEPHREAAAHVYQR
jgi:diguanylate cyclase (GGDEF)-like protein